MFKDQLNEYMVQLGCSGRELAEISGLSPATVSRYRSGERKPESEAARAKLISGIVQLAAARGIHALSEENVSAALRPFFPEESVDAEHLRDNLNSLFTTFSISNSELARSTNYDASYLSRIRSGQRHLADPERFVSAVADFVIRRFDSPTERAILAELIHAKEAEEDTEVLYGSLVQWLGGHNAERNDDVAAFLGHLDEFDLNEYTQAIRFDDMKVPTPK